MTQQHTSPPILNTYHTEIRTALNDYKTGLGLFKEKLPHIAEHYHTFTGACFTEGSLDPKTKHLLALGMSLAIQDEYCMIYHVHEALQLGGTPGEILEVVGVSAALSGGASMSQGVTLVQQCLEEFGHAH